EPALLERFQLAANALARYPLTVELPLMPNSSLVSGKSKQWHGASLRRFYFAGMTRMECYPNGLAEPTLLSIHGQSDQLKWVHSPLEYLWNTQSQAIGHAVRTKFPKRAIFLEIHH